MLPMAVTIESAIDQFEQRWRAGQPPVIEEFLREVQPPADQRTALLVELIAIEMEYCWRMSRSDDPTRDSTLAATEPSSFEDRGPTRAPLLETYAARWPEITTDARSFLDLVVEEYRIRHRWGDQPSTEEFDRRFDGLPDLQPALENQKARLLVEQPTRIAEETLPHAAEATFAAGQQFGRYRILSQLGQGGMGEVYLAEDTQLHRRVALKLPFLREQQRIRERFLNEARATASLQHPGICAAFDAGEIDGQPFLTMPYIDGTSLREHWREHPRTSPSELALLFSRIASAMDAAHNAGVVHRDLKPSNIMLDATGRPVVTDFGLAHREHDAQDVRLTRSGEAFGSPAYMSPEQVEGRSSEIGPSSDIYSLGVILFEAMTGKLPFEGSTASVMHQIVHDSPPRPATLCETLDSGLEQLCLEMLAKSSKQRPQSMAVVAARLEQIGRRLSTETVPPSRHGGLGRRRRIVMAAVAGLIALFAGTTVFLQPPPPSTETTSSQPQEARSAGSTTNSTEMVATPTGHALAFDGLDDALLTPIRYDGRTPFTIEAWIAPADPYGNGTIFSNDDGSGLSLRQHYAERSRERTWSLTLGPPARPLREATVASHFDHRAVHLAAVWDGTRLSLFVDGKLHLSGVAKVDNMPLMNETFTVGTRPRAISKASSSGVWFHGEIDEIRFSHIARYRSDFAPDRHLDADEATDALYHLDEGSGNRAHDASGAENHGEILGGRWIPASHLNQPGEYASQLESFAKAIDRPTAGSAGPALRFSRASAHVTVPPLGSALQAPFTIEAWVEPDLDYVPDDWKRVAAQIGPFSMTVQNDHDAIAFQAWFGNRRGVDVSSHWPDTAQYGRRTHIAVQCTGDELQLFVNGQRAPAIPTLRNLYQDDARRLIHEATATIGEEILTLGRRGNGKSSWGGLIDRFRISSGLRYGSSFEPADFETDSETILLFDFHEGSGNILHDVSGNGHHGAIVDAEWILPEP